MTRQSKGAPRLLAAVATIFNFPIVLIGLLLIVIGTDGDDTIALLNLWAVWGLANTLLGQIGLLAASTDGRSWVDRRSLELSAGFAVATGVVLGMFRNILFPGHGWWWLIGAVLAAAAHLAGRQRGAMTTRNDGAATVVITAIENLLRVALIGVVVLVGTDAIAPASLAIAAPFVLTIAIQARRLQPGDVDALASPKGNATPVAIGVLAGLPGVSAYGLVPALTLLGDVEDLDEIAFAVSLLRGPLIVAVFASAWLLERLRRHRVSTTAPAILALALLATQLTLERVVEPGLTVGLALHGACAGAALLTGYTIVLADSARLARDPWTPAIAVVACVAYAAALGATHVVDFIHPFVALTALVTAMGLFISVRASRIELPT